MLKAKALNLSLIFTIWCIPLWWRLDYAAPPFSLTYVFGFFALIPLGISTVLWIINGVPGLYALLANPWRLSSAIALGLLAAWGLLSVNWAFVAADRPHVAAGASLQFAIAIGGAVMLACATPSPRLIVYALISGALIHGVIGGLQVAAQSDIGLNAIGEFALSPQQAGTSVIQSGGQRWLRPYGLASHPNVYAGYMVLGLLACSVPIFSTQQWHRRVGWASAAFILWIVLLTFSRSAWLGAAVGGAFILMRHLRILWQTQRRTIFISAGIALVLGASFFLLYRPLLLARAGVGTEATEVRSVADRAVYTDAALVAIEQEPLFGMGSGNFPWYASNYLFYHTDTGYRGDNVHNIYLTIQAELGGMGTVLFLAALLTGLYAARQPITVERSALLGGIFALLAVGVFDHYPATVFHFQFAFWSILAASATQA